jgi:hypothetical protein
MVGALRVNHLLEKSPNLEKLTIWLNMKNCLVKNKKNHCNFKAYDGTSMQWVEEAGDQSIKMISLRDFLDE